MSDNTEKKVLISVEILDNFLAAKTNLDKWKKSLKEAEDSGSATQEQLRDIATELAKANNEFKDAKIKLESAAKSQEMFTAMSDKANRSIGEMQRELKALRNVPFDNLSPEEIAQVEQAMADLTAEIDDYKIKIKGLDTGEFAKNLTGVAQAGTATLQITGQLSGALGMQGEVFEKLQKSTLELIGVTQALGVVSDFLGQKKLALVTANIKNIAVSAKETIATKASALAHVILGRSVDATSTKFKMLRAAIISTGIGALVVLIGVLIANWDKLSASLSGTIREQKRLDSELSNTANQLSRIKDNTDFDAAIAEAAGKSKEELLKMRLEAARAANDLAYLKMRQVMSNDKASKEQKDKAIQMEQETYDRVKSILDESTIYYVSKKKEQTNAAKTNLEKDSQATFDILSRNKNEQIRLLLELASDIKKSYSERISALSKAESEKIKLLELSAAREKSKAGLTAAQKRKIETDLAYDIKIIKKETETLITEIEAQELDKRLKNEADALENKKQQLSDEQQSELIALSKRFAARAKQAKYSSELNEIEIQYEKERTELIQKFREEEFNASVDSLTQILTAENLSAEQRISIEKAVAETKSRYAKESADITIKANEEITKNHAEQLKKQEEAEKQLSDKRKELLQQLHTTLQDIAGGYFDRQFQNLDTETEKVNSEYDKRIQAAGNNDKRMRELETQRERRLAEIESEKRKKQRQQALIERAFAAFSIGLSTGKAVMAALSPPPVGLGPVAGVPLAITTGAIGALQLGSVLSQPLPKARRGKVFRGKSHAQGGIPVEVEGDEIILTKGVYRDPVLRNIASLINQAAGGIPLAAGQSSSIFASGGVKFTSDGGYTSRHLKVSINKEEMRDAMIEALQELKIYATIEDIRRADKNYSEIEDRASF